MLLCIENWNGQKTWVINCLWSTTVQWICYQHLWGQGKCFPLVSKAWKVIFQILIKLLHSDFLLKSNDYLQEKSRMELSDLVSLSIVLWRCYLLQLKYSQNSIVFSWLLEKKSQSSLRTKLEWDWKGYNKGSKIFFIMWRKSVMTIILDILLVFIAWLILYLIAKSSASVLITFVAWCSILIIGLLWIWISEMDITTLFLMLALVIGNYKSLGWNSQQFDSQLV